MLNRKSTDSIAVPGYDWNTKHVLLPISVLHELRMETQRLKAEEERAEEARRVARDAMRKAQDQGRGHAQHSFPAPPCDGPYLKIFERHELFAREDKLASLTGDHEEKQAMRALVARLSALGEYRRLATIPLDWKCRLAELENNYPNFYSVIRYLRGVCALAEWQDGVPHPVHIVLDGPPGVGKTHFTKRLGEFFNTDFHAVHLESMQSSGELLGEADFYRNAKPGRLFDAMIDGRYANPIIMLGEICKIAGDERFDPRNALYRLLERDTSKCFTDSCARWLTLDYSKAWFICTSNRYDSIDPALRSRLKRFKVSAPKDPTVIIRNIFAALKSELPVGCDCITLADETVELLKSHPPRQIRQMLEVAVGMALANERRSVLPIDVEVEVHERRIGFC